MSNENQNIAGGLKSSVGGLLNKKGLLLGPSLIVGAFGTLLTPYAAKFLILIFTKIGISAVLIPIFTPIVLGLVVGGSFIIGAILFSNGLGDLVKNRYIASYKKEQEEQPARNPNAKRNGELKKENVEKKAETRGEFVSALSATIMFGGFAVGISTLVAASAIPLLLPIFVILIAVTAIIAACYAFKTVVNGGAVIDLGWDTGKYIIQKGKDIGQYIIKKGKDIIEKIKEPVKEEDKDKSRWQRFKKGVSNFGTDIKQGVSNFGTNIKERATDFKEGVEDFIFGKQDRPARTVNIGGASSSSMSDPAPVLSSSSIPDPARQGSISAVQPFSPVTSDGHASRVNNIGLSQENGVNNLKR